MTLPVPYYEDAKAGITIYCGDCREILPALVAERGPFDLTLTDPPYGVSAIKADAAPRHRFAANVPRRYRWQAHQHEPVAGDDEPFDPQHLLSLAPAAVLWGANNYASRLPDSAFWLAWDRKDARAADSNITEVELAAVLGHRFKTIRIFRHMWAGFQRDSEVGERVLHPTQKPVALMSWCLGFFPDARTVVDPYMGSGPVAKACKDRGLRYVGIELVESYCERSVNRLRQGVLFGVNQ